MAVIKEKNLDLDDNTISFELDCGQNDGGCIVTVKRGLSEKQKPKEVPSLSWKDVTIDIEYCSIHNPGPEIIFDRGLAALMVFQERGHIASCARDQYCRCAEDLLKYAAGQSDAL